MVIQTDILLRLLGSESAVQRFIGLFQQQWPLQLEEMDRACREADWETLGNAAHALKSQCRYMGLEALALRLEQIERLPSEACASGDISAVRAIFQEIELP